MILCIEDHQPALTLRKMVLEHAGYKVLTAISGRQALSRMKESHVDLVLSDHSLRGELGVAIAAEIKALQPGVPILLISGAENILAGPHVDGVISKADGPTKLLVHVARILGL